MTSHYSIEKRQYDCRGVHDMSIDEKKNVTIECYILFHAAVRDKDV